MAEKYKEYLVHDKHSVHGFFEEYRFLSNFHLSDVYYEGDLYPSTEHAFQAAKYPRDKRTPFIDMDISCMVAKKLGRKKDIPEFDIAIWDAKKYEVMCAVVFDKFYRHHDLRHLLLETGDRHLEETNHWWDMYWGVCQGKGENNLGEILMKVREFWQASV